MDVAEHLLASTRRLLQAIAEGDWATYEQLCAADLTAFEPEARGQRVEGLPFHKFYFDLGGGGAVNTTMVDPRVQLLGPDQEAAVVTYVRLVQRMTEAGPVSASFEETRVWERRDGRWVHVHFHRSANGG